MQLSIGQVYRAAWQDLKGNTTAWIVLALLLVVPIWCAAAIQDVWVSGIVELVSLIFSMAAVKIALHIVDEQNPVLESVVPSFLIGVKILVAFFLLAIPFIVLATAVALVPVLLIPAIIVGAAAFSFVILLLTLMYYVMLDKNEGIIQSLSTTFALVKQRPLMLAWFVVVSAGINLAGFLVLTLGLPVTLPLSMIAGARVYRALTAEEMPASEPMAMPEAI
ncbi:MAG: hypothetical protein ABSH12_04750 [Endomicrobiales bacterium]|jgi:uncharacterized membrane protein